MPEIIEEIVDDTFEMAPVTIETFSQQRQPLKNEAVASSKPNLSAVQATNPKERQVERKSAEKSPFEKFISEAVPDPKLGKVPSHSSMDSLIRDFGVNQKTTAPKKNDYWGDYNDYANDDIESIPDVTAKRKQLSDGLDSEQED